MFSSISYDKFIRIFDAQQFKHTRELLVDMCTQFEKKTHKLMCVMRSGSGMCRRRKRDSANNLAR